MREIAAVRQSAAGMPGARAARMAHTTYDESWTIPLRVIMWTTIVVGIVMAMAVVMMH